MRISQVLVVGLAFLATACAQKEVAQPPQANKPLEQKKGLVGLQAASFTLNDSTGKALELQSVIGKRPVVLVWYRGDWWPFCHSQFGELASIQGDLKTAGARVFGISVEDSSALESMKKAEGLDDDVFTMLSDPRGEAARSYAGLADPQMHNPATYVIGLDGTILFEYLDEDYTKRAVASDVLEAVRKSKV